MKLIQCVPSPINLGFHHCSELVLQYSNYSRIESEKKINCGKLKEKTCINRNFCNNINELKRLCNIYKTVKQQSLKGSVPIFHLQLQH